MNLEFIKKSKFPDANTGTIFFNSDTQKIYLKDNDGWICYSTEPIPVEVLPDYIGYGTTSGDAQTVTLNSSKFFIIGRCKSLTITLPDGADLDCQEYCCQFYVPSDDFTLTVPDTVKWQNGEAPTFEAGTCYQMVICNNCATIGMFK